MTCCKFFCYSVTSSSFYQYYKCYGRLLRLRDTQSFSEHFMSYLLLTFRNVLQVFVTTEVFYLLLFLHTMIQHFIILNCFYLFLNLFILFWQIQRNLAEPSYVYSDTKLQNLNKSIHHIRDYRQLHNYLLRYYFINCNSKLMHLF